MVRFIKKIKLTKHFNMFDYILKKMKYNGCIFIMTVKENHHIFSVVVVHKFKVFSLYVL